MSDTMDICESSYPYVIYAQPTNCEQNDAPPDARCISVDSDSSGDLLGGNILAEGHGDIFDDYYIYPTVLGTGNYGCVRACRHRFTGAKYAVKTIEKRRVARHDHIRREVELLRTVDHPGIMKMVDCYEDADCVHIVTEMYTGGELFDKIVDQTNDYGCLREKETARIMKSLLEAVQYLHSRDIVHRDIKPENLLFETDKEGSSVKLIDFGLSRTHSQNDAAMSNQVGTPYYMSPSVLRGCYDRSCDMWAVGVTAYIMLAGYPPFNGETDQEVLISVRLGNLAFDRHAWGHRSPACRDFVRRLLRRDPSKILTAEEALMHPWVANA